MAENAPDGGVPDWSSSGDKPGSADVESSLQVPEWQDPDPDRTKRLLVLDFIRLRMQFDGEEAKSLLKLVDCTSFTETKVDGVYGLAVSYLEDLYTQDSREPFHLL